MLKAGIIGTGFIGNAHAEAYQNMKDVHLAAIVDVNEETGQKAAEKHNAKYYKDAEEMLKSEDIDIVDICLPTFLHEQFVLLAAKYKKHVICEKPFTLTLESAQRMINATRQAGVKFMIAQVIRFWPEYSVVKDYFDEGKIGDLKMVYANRLAQHPNWTTWHKDPQKSGGGLFDLHLHDIDYMCYLFGKVESVYAMGWQSETGCWNHVMSNLKFKNGEFAVVEGAFDMTENYPFTMSFRAVGSEGAINYNFIAGFNLENVGGATRNTVYFRNGEEPDVLKIEDYDAYQKELEYFADCIVSDKPIEVVSPEDSKDVLAVIQAIQKSLESGEVVTL